MTETKKPTAPEALALMREALAATTGRLSGYDWNADPDSITRLQGDAFTAADEATD